LEYAEKAFFDIEMVSKLYFPDKYAIYSPLFGPLALPLVIALLKELHGIFKGWKNRRLKVNEARKEKTCEPKGMANNESSTQ